ncbi:MAG: carbohydrate binding family 9 domain-containing protein [Candidatus Aminicenantes bacterium]|nr:carbohydrate binding family 9 domain-containing protein [Candidatus Aminicenantes bacterium]
MAIGASGNSRNRNKFVLIRTHSNRAGNDFNLHDSKSIPVNCPIADNNPGSSSRIFPGSTALPTSEFNPSTQPSPALQTSQAKNSPASSALFSGSFSSSLTHLTHFFGLYIHTILSLVFFIFLISSIFLTSSLNAFAQEKQKAQTPQKSPASASQSSQITQTAHTQSISPTSPNPNLNQKKIAYTHRLNPHAPTIDGRLDDPAWQTGEWFSDFIQFHPYEGQPPTEQTAFKIVYDDSHLFLAIRCYDSQPQTIERRLSRRDNTSGDYILVFFDSLQDLRTSYCFAVNAAGVKADQIISNDNFDENNVDISWDPVREVKTAIDEQGWTAEMKIPFSQLRFDNKEEQVWGFEVMPQLFRKNEISLWQHIPKNAPGWVSQFGELRGIVGLKPPRQIEIIPYTVGAPTFLPTGSRKPIFQRTRKKSVWRA